MRKNRCALIRLAEGEFGIPPAIQTPSETKAWQCGLKRLPVDQLSVAVGENRSTKPFWNHKPYSAKKASDPAVHTERPNHCGIPCRREDGHQDSHCYEYNDHN